MLLASNPAIYLICVAWRYVTSQKWRCITYVILSATALLISLLEPWVIGKVLNAIQTPGTPGEVLYSLALYLIIFFLLSPLFWALHGPSRIMEREVAFHIRIGYQMRLFNTVTGLPMQWHRDNHSGATIDVVSRASGSLFDFCQGSFEIIQMFTRFVGSIVILICFMPSIGVTVLAASCALIAVIVLFDQVLVAQYQELNRRWNFTASGVQDYLSNIVTVISLRLEDKVGSEVLSRLKAILPTFRKNIVVNELKWFTVNLVMTFLIAVMPLWYAYSTLAHGETLLVGTFFTLFEYLRRLRDAFFGFALKWSSIVQQAANVRAADRILESLGCGGVAQSAQSLPKPWRELNISELCFTYEDEKRREHHLDSVSLSLAPGKRIALVGESGSGKSTLLSVLRGLHVAKKVRVECDGAALPSGLCAIACNSTLIPQDPEIFGDTIRFNISLGIAADDSSLLEAIGKAQFEAVLRRLPSGLDTNIAEKGVNLSGGEKQRLALARGLFFAGQSDIILLDEPTSNVDPVNERKIYEQLFRFFNGRCVISAIHKLHLLPMFDEVYVFSDGALEEKGTFETLLAKGGRLHAMWQIYKYQHRDEMKELM